LQNGTGLWFAKWNGFVVCKMKRVCGLQNGTGSWFAKWNRPVLIKADIGATFGVHSHSTSGVQCDPQPAQLLAEVHVEGVVGIAAKR
jgi:hypothetical protein